MKLVNTWLCKALVNFEKSWEARSVLVPSTGNVSIAPLKFLRLSGVLVLPPLRGLRFLFLPFLPLFRLLLLLLLMLLLLLLLLLLLSALLLLLVTLSGDADDVTGVLLVMLQIIVCLSLCLWP